jgi:predicted 3-demethylubiquinone-9 3-methyltransferase (glyoxalase superfamily)
VATLSKIRPCLWFNDQSEEAAAFYCSVFPNSKITTIARYTAEGREHHGKEPGSVMTVAFELDGQQICALNGGPQFKFDEAVSLMVQCETQDEIDYYWGKLSADPNAEVCGWCKDRFGVSWQIVYAGADEMMRTASEAQMTRVMKVIMASKKLDIARIREAYNG